jgi:hypothetical protein
MENENDGFQSCEECGVRVESGFIDDDGMCDECSPWVDSGSTHVAAAGQLGFLWRKADFNYLWHTQSESFYEDQAHRFPLAMPCEIFEKEKFRGKWWMYWYETCADALLAKEIAQNCGEIAYLLHDSCENFDCPVLLTTMGDA